MENWLPVVGFPGYEVSDLGNVRGSRGWILKPALGNGYLRVNLFGEKKKSALVHRIVAEAFLGPCPAGKEVDHRNDIRTDNRAVNLQYLMRSENQRKKPKWTGCSSSYIGVCRQGNGWVAGASAEKSLHIGRFGTEEEAARARDKFYRDKGQLVVFNFPP